MPDEVAPTVARVQRRVQEDRDEDAAFRIVEDPGHDDSNQYCHNNHERHLHDHRYKPDFLIKNLSRNKEERQVPQGPQWTDHQRSPPCPEALLQVGNGLARPASFFPDLNSKGNNQDVWQERCEVQWPLLDESSPWCYPQEDTRERQLEQGHANEH